MLDFSLAAKLQFVSVQDGFVQPGLLGICGLRWLAFWLYTDIMESQGVNRNLVIVQRI
jgi:hypothetical protein